MNFFKGLTAILIGTCIVASTVLAEKPAPDTNFPQKTLLAASGNLPSDVAVPLPSGMKIGQLPPITGGVSRNGKGLCSYTVSNNFSKSIEVDLSIRQYNVKQQRISSNAASWRLKPAETNKGEIRELPNTAGCALVLESWKLR